MNKGVAGISAFTVSLVSLVSLLSLASLAGVAHADTPAITYGAPGVEFNNGGGYSLGYAFAVTSTVTVTQLGYFDPEMDGLAEAHDVGIYDSGANLLGSATVTNSDPLNANFRYTSVSPFNLSPGIYYAVGQSGFVDAYGFFPDTLTTIPEIAFGGSVYSLGNVLAFPTAADGVDGYFGPNFQVVVPADVPEPGVVTFGILAVGGVLGLIARKRRN